VHGNRYVLCMIAERIRSLIKQNVKEIRGLSCGEP
jgi:hypothetical protein